MEKKNIEKQREPQLQDWNTAGMENPNWAEMTTRQRKKAAQMCMYSREYSELCAAIMGFREQTC